MKKLTRFSSLSLIFFISGCGFYNPNLRNSPMLTKAGEVQGSGHYHVGRGFEAQGAVAITNHIGIIGSYSQRKEGQPDNPYFEKRSFVEGGIGYFKKKTERIGFEVFAGYGEGGVTLLNEVDMASGTNFSQSGKIHRVFIQPALLDHGKVFSAAFVPRVSYVSSSGYQITGDYSNNSPFKDGLYFEPSGVGRVKLHQNFFFTFQAGICARLFTGGQQHPFVQTGAGLGFRLNGER